MRIRINNLGTLTPSKEADQENPRRCYVYAHVDADGNYFYIGKGTGRRAWSTDRHPLWQRYVEKHLKGQYQVKILHDNLDNDEAENLEADWMDKLSDMLVNWVNMRRNDDLKAIERMNKLRDENRQLIAAGKLVEKTDLPQAIKMYKEAISNIPEYAFVQPCGGLTGKLIDEENREKGIRGELEALDRLTLCLVKLKKAEEAAHFADEYFSTYRGDIPRPGAERVKKRIAKALAQ